MNYINRISTLEPFSHAYFFKDCIYLFLERREGKEKERET